MTLPQFLLSFAKSRWMWLGFRPPIPTENARWSFSRVLALTLMQAVGMAILGWLLSVILGFFVYRAGPFVLFHGLFSWLIWLMAALGVLQGLLGYGLTAVCWNQRAARLRADPKLDTSLPPTRYRVFRWMLGFVYFILLCVITPLVILVTFENARAEILWKRERATLLAKGEKLDFPAILGPAIPSEQNAGAAPVFAQFFNYSYEPDPGNPGVRRAVWRDLKSLERLEDCFKLPDRQMRAFEEETRNSPLVNLDAWSKAYRELAKSPERKSDEDPTWGGELKLPAPGDSARDVLAGLSVADAQLSAICEASARPRCQFPIHYNEAFGTTVRHLSFLRSVSQDLELRCAAHLAAGETGAAFADAQSSLRLEGLLREEPLLISQLVRMALGTITTKTIWQGLAQHHWTDAQLAFFQDQFTRTDYLPGMVLGFEGERTCGDRTFDALIVSPRATPDLFVSAESGGLSRWPGLFLSRAMLRQNQIAVCAYNSSMIMSIRDAIAASPKTGLAAAVKAASDTTEFSQLTNSVSPYTILARMIVPATSAVLGKAARAQTVSRMAAVGCALERYHLKHGAFPEKLDDLAPAFFNAVPLDPMVNQPFHYQRTDDGWFQLYSVGLNGQDDKGVFKEKQSEKDLDWPWPVPSRPARFRLF